jgi:hypothetical protein
MPLISIFERYKQYFDHSDFENRLKTIHPGEIFVLDNFFADALCAELILACE